MSYLSHNRNWNNAFLFRSYEHAICSYSKDGLDPGKAELLEHNPRPAHAIPIWKVGRATSAAPSYFDPMEIDGQRFIDGGFGCNNPSTVAYFEVTQMHNHAPDVINVFLSVGTGEPDFQCGAGSGLTNFLTMLKALPKVVANGRASHEFMANLKKTHNVPYHRWNVLNELGNLRMDEWILGDNDKATQRRIEKLTETYLAKPGILEEMRSVAQQLVSHRRERAKTPRWERVATGARYRCTFPRCSSGHRHRDTEPELHRHFRTRHSHVSGASLRGYTTRGRIQ